MTNKRKENIDFWFNSEFFTVGLFALAGVAIRDAITTELVTTTTSTKTAAFQSFTELFHGQAFLVSNFLGCFIMSFCVSNQKAIEKVSKPLYIGITTGLCGSITTLSSWMNGTVSVVFGSKNWVLLFITITLQFWLIWSAFLLGFAAARLLEEQQTSSTPLVVTSASANKMATLLPPPPPPPVPSTTASLRKTEVKRGFELVPTTGIEAAAADSVEASPPATPAEASPGDINDTDEEIGDTATTKEIQLVPPSPPLREQVYATLCRIYELFHVFEWYVWAGLFATTMVIVWIILASDSQAAYFKDDLVVRNTYRSVALAPLGAWARWALGRIPRIKDSWPDMYPHTLLANLGAVFFMCMLSVLCTSSWVPAINTGMYAPYKHLVCLFVCLLVCLYAILLK
jgi:fluoride ion exporter CrcB/FEX